MTDLVIAPPPHSKLPPSVWQRAATLFEREAGRVRLRTLCAECGVSHRTAWRIREYLRDRDALRRERALYSPLQR